MYRSTCIPLGLLAVIATLVACSPSPEEARDQPSLVDARPASATDVATTDKPQAAAKQAPINGMVGAQVTPPTPADAEAVVRDYYAAINARDFARAHAHWSDNGAASGQTLEAFTQGYAQTESVEATVGTATAEEGAAGSRYILVPVELHSKQQDGSTRRYRGFFTLRAVMADGASDVQRQWHLASAEIQRLPD